MRVITPETWLEQIAPYHFPSYFSLPIRMMYDAWNADLPSLLEVFKWARIVATKDIMPSVFVAQIALESGFGKHQNSLLGVKATATDIQNGTCKRMLTKEVFTEAQVAALGDDLVAVEHTYPDGRQLVSCYQMFHYEPGLADDFEKYIRVYQTHFTKYKKPRPTPSTSPEDFLLNVTQAKPPYATDSEYVDKILAIIKTRDLHPLDMEFCVHYWSEYLKEKRSCGKT